MTQPISTPATKPALIAYGADKKGRLHASWFTADEAHDAERASGEMGYSTRPLTLEDEQALALKVPRGRLCRNGRAHVPIVSDKLIEVLRFLSTGSSPVPNSTHPVAPAMTDGASGDAPEIATPTAPSPTDSSGSCRPQDWDEIGLGSMVLAYDPPSEAWYEARVVNALNDTFRLTWRDYPEEGVVTRQRNQLALLHPVD